MPKKIIYLFGAGASHAVVKNSNATKGLMTSNIQEVIEKKYQNKNKFDTEVWNALITENNDVEHLISYLEFKYDYASSNLVRKYYREAIINLSNKYSSNPPKLNLYSILLDMHLNIENLKNNENLQCFITLNYEDILENTIIKYYNRKINYNFNRQIEDVPNSVKVYKLHGSFNWSNERPVTVATKMTDVKSEKALWIPPGVDKKKENYPFNLLWGDAVEQLLNNCDILRIVGCSLSRNDWGLIPILYDIQKFSGINKNLTIEIVDFKRTSDKIKDDYKYLKVVGLDENQEVKEYLSSTYGIDEGEINSYLDSAINPMQLWLESKLSNLYSDTLIKHKKGSAYKFYHKV